MKKIWEIGILVVVAVIFCVSSIPAEATIQLHWAGLGNSIGGYYNNPPTSGIGYGLIEYHENWSCEIVFDLVSGIPGIADNSSLITFCVEWNEKLIGENNFNAVLNTGAAKGGTGGQTSPESNFDPLSAESAWLYDQYLDGNTFDIAVDDSTSSIAALNRKAAVVQEAIWSLENELEWTHAYIETDGVISSASAAVTGGWTNQNVKVLNITWASEGATYGQDALVRIPEPATIFMLVLGSLTFFLYRKS